MSLLKSYPNETMFCTLTDDHENESYGMHCRIFSWGKVIKRMEMAEEKNDKSDLATFDLENWKKIQILNHNISLLFYLFICLMDVREHGGQSVEILGRRKFLDSDKCIFWFLESKRGHEESNQALQHEQYWHSG